MRARGLALLAALLLLGGCGGEGGSGGRSAEELLKSASQKQARSADLDMALELKLDGVEQLKDPVKLTLKGPYRSNGAKQLPDFDFRIGYDAGPRKGDFGLTGSGQNLFAAYNGQTYEVGRDLVGRYLSQPRPRGTNVNWANWLKDGEVKDDGRTVTGEVDVPRMLADINRVIAKTPGARQVPQATIDQIDESVKEAALEIRIGPDDVLRSTIFDLRFELSEELRSKARGLRGGRVGFRFGQSNVNGGQRIDAPSGARPIAELLRSFGVPPEALLGPGAGLQAPG